MAASSAAGVPDSAADERARQQRVRGRRPRASETSLSRLLVELGRLAEVEVEVAGGVLQRAGALADAGNRPDEQVSVPARRRPRAARNGRTPSAYSSRLVSSGRFRCSNATSANFFSSNLPSLLLTRVPVEERRPARRG